jgi:hypothetical protein
MSMTKTANEKEAVLNVFASMMRPMIRVAFEYGISAGEISRTLKSVYVLALQKILTEQGRPITDARLAIMSGLSGSDVKSLRDESAPHNMDAGITPERIGNVLTTWNSDPKFTTAYGLARELEQVPVEGRPSFQELVAVACPGGGVDVDALLDSLLAAKSVEVVDGVVRCLTRAYVTSSPDANRIEQIGRFAELVISTFAHNLLRTDAEARYFEQAVVSDARLTEAGRDEFLSKARSRGQELLFEFDNLLTQLDSSMKSEAGKRYGLGIYFFEDPISDEPNRFNAELRSSQRLQTEKVPAPLEEIDVLAASFGKKK